VARHVVLLRGVNLGSHNRVAMPKLRGALEDAGFDDVQTYLQSGNVVLSSALTPAEAAERCRRVLVDGFELDVEVLVRSRQRS